MMKHLFLLLLLCVGFMANAQVTLEDFEGGVPDLPWAAINGGTYLGSVANPDASGINTSGFVGTTTNVAPGDFCFLLTDLPSAVDLSVAGLVKMKVWSPITCQVLFKFEGGGNQVEQFKDITVANQWTELTFDLSTAAAITSLNKCLVAFNPFTAANGETFYFDDIRTVSTTQCYETFEGGNALPWNALDGTFSGPVANPMPNWVNPSAECGEYIKSATTGYSLLLADNGTISFDLSIQNQFSMDVYTDAPTQVLFKLEGNGQSLEVIKNIGVAGAWQTYTFDMSAAAAYTGLTKIVIFFDPGTETSSDTYFFDNICAKPQGACAGYVPVANLIDDFECNRNATYTNGWESLLVVANPAAGGANTSSKVGQYTDPETEEWAALVVDYQNPLDLSTFNQFKVKVWSPGAPQILFKLEGGTSAPVEVFQTVVSAGAWHEYTVDFSAQALANHKKIAMFFNPGTLPTPGDIYYIDDLRWAQPESATIEDFEGGAFLPWQPLDNNTALHGVFSVIANPDATGINTSAQVGKYIKGSSPFSTVEAVAPGVLDISTKPQFNLDIWAPVGATTVTMQLESPTLGNAEVTRDLSTPGAWENISFDFSSFQSTNNWVAIRLLFKPATAENGTIYYYDNLTQSTSTVDPCEGIVTLPNIVDDYECQRNYAYGAGAAQLTVIDNPDVTVVNGSAKVGQFNANANSAYQALCAEMPDGIDLSVYNQFELQVWGNAVPILCKLEGGSSPAVEVSTASTTANAWEKVTVDFSPQVGQDHKRVCVFMNAGVDAPATTYYLDNIKFAHAPFDGCIINYETAAFSSLNWKYFPADNSGAFEQVANPDASGVNTSANVGQATEKATGEQPWQGMFTDLPAPIRFTSDKLVKMKVWSPQVATITMKLENPANTAAPGSSGDNTIANTVANAWEELTWDFSASPTPIPDNGDYQRITLIWDIQNVPAADVIYYFDDIAINGAICTPVGTNDKMAVQTMRVMPNPAKNMISATDFGQANRLEITNSIGQRTATVQVGNDTQTSFDISNLAPGMYFISGYDAFGHLVANARFIKN
jgi:hypothetical protein